MFKSPLFVLKYTLLGHGGGAVFPQRHHSKQGLAQILPLLLPQFVHFFFSFQN